MRKLVAPIADIHEGSIAHRATIVGKNEEIKSIKRLSYKPANKNSTYQRASVPWNTAFYGVYDPEQNIVDHSSCMMSLYETCPLIRKEFKPNQSVQMVVSEWVVTHKISLFALATTDERNKSTFLNEIGKGFAGFVKTNNFSDVDIAHLNEFQNYMTERYNVRIDDKNDYEYIISALFAETIKANLQRQKGIDGVIWHSSLATDYKLDKTLSFALFPEAANTKLQFSRCFKLKIETDNSQIHISRPNDITASIIDK